MADLNNNDGAPKDGDGNEAGNAQKVSDLTRQQKRMIREKRFGSDQYSGLDPSQIHATLEAEKIKR